MARINFTKAAIEALPLPLPGKRAYHYDTKVRGLGIAITDRGVRTFIVYRWVRGKPERVTLGRFPDLSIEQARKLTEQANAAFAMGQNPAESKRQIRGEMTVGELFERYLELHAKVHKRSWKADENQFKRYLEGWRNTKISRIRPSDIQALHARLGQENGIYAANRTLALLHTMFNKAVNWGWDGKNPVHGVRKFRERSRERFIQPHELPAFFHALADEPNHMIRDFFLLCILTGARRANVMAMRWEEIEFEPQLWTIPQTKSGTPHRLPLPEEAIRVLLSREREGPWVFPGTGASGHLEEPKAGWKRILKRSGLKDLRIHDLRRSLGSHMAAGGASLPIIGKALHQQSVSTTAIYARLNLDPVRKAMEKATRTMLRLAGQSEVNESAEEVPGPEEAES